jgi:signal transduction histidine kinase
MKRLRSLSAQLLLLIVLPLFVVLSAVAFGSVVAHQRSMRALIGERDLRAVLAAAAGLSAPDGLPDEQHIRAVLAELQASPETVVMLVGPDQRIMYDTNPQNVGQVSSDPGVAEALAGRSGLLYRSEQPGGPEYVVAYAPVPVSAANGKLAGWGLVVNEPWGEVLNPWLRMSLMGPLILVPAVAAAMAALWLAVQRVIRPLQQLDTRVTALGQGDFEAVDAPVGGIEEIRKLQGALARMAAQIRAYQQSMRGYLGVVTAAQEDERKRLARELHDETIQDLIALKQRVQMARRKAARDPAGLGTQLAELQTMLETTMDRVRRFSRALRPIYLEEAGLVAALEALARDAGQEEPQVTFAVVGEPCRLVPETELALYRIAQEALRNTARHAQALNVKLGVEFDEGVTIRVQDDGVGFVAPERMSDLAAAGHYGLMGMRERAELAGAHLVVLSQPRAGTTIEVSWHPAGAAAQP